MKFIYMTEVDISIDNGPGINEREFIKALIKDHGDKVISIVPRPSKPEIYHSNDVEYVASHKGHKIFFYLLFLLSVSWKIFRLHRRHKLDAMVFRLGVIPIVPCFLSSVLGIPIILKTLAGYSIFERRDRTWSRQLLSKLIFPFYKKNIRFMIAADTVGLTYIEWLYARFNADRKKIHLIPNGTDIDQFSPADRMASKTKLGLESFDYIIGYIGALDSLRNVDMLIHAAKQLNKEKNVGLVVVGDGKQRDRLQQQVKSEGVADFVVFTGAILYQDVPMYMNAFDIAVDLSSIPMEIDGKMYKASYSQKIAQYLSCGLPVVAWDVIDNGFIDKENIGKLAVAGDEEDLLVQLQQILDMSDDERNELSKRARNYAEDFLSISKLTEHRLKIWQSAINDHSK